MHVVSSSQLGASEDDIANARRLMDGPDVRHYWDGERRLGKAVSARLGGLQDPAWDVWLLYGPGVVWGDAPVIPAPDWWEHQLRALMDRHPDRHLDAERFAAKAAELSRRALAAAVE